MRASALVRAQQRPDAAREAREREARLAACRRATEECSARFAPIAEDNVREALRWQEARICELLEESGEEARR